MPEGEDRTRKLNAELANGRLAMMAIIGMFYQDGLTGSPWGDWALYTDSPLRAFENELGVQPPVGFWFQGPSRWLGADPRLRRLLRVHWRFRRIPQRCSGRLRFQSPDSQRP